MTRPTQFETHATPDPFDMPPRSVSMSAPSRPLGMSRVIGACCGAFVFCFTAILLSLPMLLNLGQAAASSIWLVGLVLGAIGGAVFPRVGYFLAYAFLIFLNICLSLTIGKNPAEQALLFGIFTFVETVFLMAHFVLRANRP